jgi:hypothetical protein
MSFKWHRMEEHHMSMEEHNMNRLSIIPLIIAGLLGVLLFTGRVYAATLSPPTAAKRDLTTFDLRYENGLIDARIDNAPLGKVLHGLALKTGIQIHLADPVIGNWPILASVRGMPLIEGVKQILKGFSYALYPAANGPVVIVLSTQPDPAKISDKTTAAALKPASLAQPIPAISKEAPQSLDEFQPISVGDALSGADGERELSPEEQLAVIQEHDEALLKRALDVLKSDYKHLYAEAIDQLVGILDPRATQALVEAASTGPDAKSRAQAAEGLWQHAAHLQFADATSVTALKQLAEDSDANVSAVAHRALQDMQQYPQGNASNSY